MYIIFLFFLWARAIELARFFSLCFHGLIDPTTCEIMKGLNDTKLSHSWLRKNLLASEIIWGNNAIPTTNLCPKPHLQWNKHSEQYGTFRVLTGLAVFKLRLLRIKNPGLIEIKIIMWSFKILSSIGNLDHGRGHENVMLKFSVVRQ